jgi:DNA integrity scanning protein DisA with diadenylate cyclase activity
MQRKTVNKLRKSIEKEISPLANMGNKIADQIETLINDARDDDETYQMDKSEKWLLSERGEEFQERLDNLDNYDDLISELRHLTYQIDNAVMEFLNGIEY